MFVFGAGRSVGRARREQIWWCLVDLKQATRRWETEGSTKLQGYVVGGNRLRLRDMALDRLSRSHQYSQIAATLMSNSNSGWKKHMSVSGTFQAMQLLSGRPLAFSQGSGGTRRARKGLRRVRVSNAKTPSRGVRFRPCRTLAATPKIGKLF